MLSYSVEANVLPKLDWLQNGLELSSEALKAKIVVMPAALGYSLKGRYKPRLRACRLAAADEMAVLNGIALTDARFCKRIGVELEVLHACQAEEEG